MHHAQAQHPAASLQPLNWNDLRVFLALSQHLSTRRAAQALHLDGTTVGRRLKALEERLGTQLFERIPEGLRLTGPGREVLRAATAMGERVRELEHRVAGLDSRVHGVVRLTVAEIFGNLICECLAPLIDRNPELELELYATDTMVALEQHAAEVALRVADEPPPTLVGRRLARSAVGLYASTDYIHKHGDDMKHDAARFIAWPRAVEGKPAFKWLSERYPERRHALRANSASGVLQAVKSGLGIAPLACVQAIGEPSLVLLKRLPTSCSTQVWLLTHPQVKDLARVRVVIDHLSHALQARRADIEGS